MKFTTEIEGKKISTYGVNEITHKLVCEMIIKDKDKVANYTLEDPDEDTIESWIEKAKDEFDMEYAEWLSHANENGIDLYTLYDHIGDFKQPIGDVKVEDV